MLNTGKEAKTIVIDKYTFQHQFGKKYYEYGGKYHNAGFDEDMYIKYTLAVKNNTIHTDSFKEIYTGCAICG